MLLERSSLEDRMREWIQRIPGADRLTHRSNPRICGGRSTVLGKGPPTSCQACQCPFQFDQFDSILSLTRRYEFEEKGVLWAPDW